MRSFERREDFGDPFGPSTVSTEWEYVRTHRRPGAPDGSLPIRVLLIEEAVRVIDQRGPRAVSIIACARTIGVSNGAPYTWFADAADFRAAVTATLVQALVVELDGHPADGDGDSDGGDGSDGGATTRIAADVDAIVRAWAACGLSAVDIFAAGGPASKVELARSRNRLLTHLERRVHDAVGCPLPTTFGSCLAHSEAAEAVVALCDGYSALARVDGEDPHRLAAAAGSSVVRLLGP